MIKQVFEIYADQILMLGSILCLTIGTFVGFWARIHNREETRIRLWFYIMSLAFLISGGILAGSVFYQQLENDNKTEKEIKLSDVVKAIKDDYCSDEEYVYSVAIEAGDRVGWSTDLIRKKISFFFKEDDEKNIVINLYSDYKSETMRIGRVKCESFDMGNYDKLECLLIKAYSNNLPFVIDMSASECEKALYQERDY